MASLPVLGEGSGWVGGGSRRGVRSMARRISSGEEEEEEEADVHERAAVKR